MRSYPPIASQSLSFPAYTTTTKLHSCPYCIKGFLDPALRSIHLGPGFCTSDNLYGLSYLLLLVLNYALAFIAFGVVWRFLSRLHWWNVVSRIFRRRNRRLEAIRTEEDVVRAERGEKESSKVSVTGATVPAIAHSILEKLVGYFAKE
ncbi:hypothetical protein T440DRAFT_471525 [Plenodomus tracheiphilus IPT5]|uniref:Uncharacterized protein n=1 Tax=Plenodomus tracheiphilus IPT5 TaxID=1408161 RepID=A0A6A7AUS4_9PLEO|nr:hypothetical protein T440DRAFT_471525 [Plenodomus tracheiphilus IPT5]